MNSDQFELWPSEVARLPWGGQSPRGLTRGAKVLYLRREPGKDDRFFADVDQYDLFRAAITGRHRYGGAPTVTPLPHGGRRRRG